MNVVHRDQNPSCMLQGSAVLSILHSSSMQRTAHNPIHPHTGGKNAPSLFRARDLQSVRAADNLSTLREPQGSHSLPPCDRNPQAPLRLIGLLSFCQFNTFLESIYHIALCFPQRLDYNHDAILFRLIRHPFKESDQLIISLIERKTRRNAS